MILILSFLVGCLTGLRSLTPIAVICWAAKLGRLPLLDTRLSFLGSLAAAIIFSILAVAELISDKLPKTPSRTGVAGLSGRAIMGALSGAAVSAAARESLILGALLGLCGGIAGAFAGYFARTGLVRALKVPDLVIALAEDLVCIAGSILLVTRY